MSSPRQHTPGPWDVEPKGSRHFVDGADGLTVAYLDRAGVRERAEIEANACLIAAAPTMFDLLTAADRLEELTGENLAVYARTFAALARAAIARATGGNAA